MQQIFVVTLPFFLLVLTGYLAVRYRVLSVGAIPGLNGFVLFFALPCMLYRFGADTPIDKLLDVGAFSVYLVSALIMVGLAFAISRKRSLGRNDAAFGALVAAFPNSGFMGMPLLITLLGINAAGPVIISLAVDMVITSSLCVALSRWGLSGEQGIFAAANGALKRVLANPLPWAILLGGVASATAFKLPSPMMQAVDMMADAGSPAALFTIGGVLARSQMTVTSEPAGSRNWGDVMTLVFFKLALHPLVVLVLGSIAIKLGAPLDFLSLSVLVLVAALPSASNVPMLAERFDADTGRIAQIVLFSTVLSFLSFSFAVAIYLW